MIQVNQNKCQEFLVGNQPVSFFQLEVKKKPCLLPEVILRLQGNVSFVCTILNKAKWKYTVLGDVFRLPAQASLKAIASLSSFYPLEL